MKSAPVTLPPLSAQRAGIEATTRIVGAGETALLAEPLLGLIASRACPGHVFLETLDQVPQWVQTGRVIVSGFHSPLEQQVFQSLLRRKGRAVKVLARSFSAQGYRPDPAEKEALAESRLLILSASPSSVTRLTRANALDRNRLVLALADECIAPHVADGSPLAALLEQAEWL